jgi:hypothetical protein
LSRDFVQCDDDFNPPDETVGVFLVFLSDFPNALGLDLARYAEFQLLFTFLRLVFLL